jgi:hypothetical protein
MVVGSRNWLQPHPSFTIECLSVWTDSADAVWFLVIEIDCPQDGLYQASDPLVVPYVIILAFYGWWRLAVSIHHAANYAGTSSCSRTLRFGLADTGRVGACCLT